MTVVTGFNLALAIHPNAHGFGWIAMQGAFTPHNWGTVSPRTSANKNAACLVQAERLMDRLNPSVLVVEDGNERTAKRVPRIQKFIRSLCALAASRGIAVAIYPLADVRAIFCTMGAATRQEIAEAVARMCPMLRPRLPKPRRAWETERDALAIFSAAALAITHDRLDADRILDALM